MPKKSRQPSAHEMDLYFAKYIGSGQSEEDFCESNGIPVELLADRVAAYKKLNESIGYRPKAEENKPLFEPISVHVSMEEPQPAFAEYELKLGNGKSLLVRGEPQSKVVRCLLSVLEG